MAQARANETTDTTGEPQTADALFSAVYERLKAMAGSHLARNRAGSTLDTTALVHELYLRVSTQRELMFGKPVQFFAYAARAMRHLLADRARDRLRLRAGGDWMRITLTGTDDRLAIDSAEQALALDEALETARGRRCARRARGRAALFRRPDARADRRGAGCDATHGRSRLAFRARVPEDRDRLTARRDRNVSQIRIGRRSPRIDRHLLDLPMTPGNNTLRDLFEQTLALPADARARVPRRALRRCGSARAHRAHDRRRFGRRSSCSSKARTRSRARSATRTPRRTCRPAAASVRSSSSKCSAKAARRRCFAPSARVDGVRQVVALKLLRRGLYSPDAQAPVPPRAARAGATAASGHRAPDRRRRHRDRARLHRARSRRRRADHGLRAQRIGSICARGSSCSCRSAARSKPRIAR